MSSPTPSQVSGACLLWNGRLGLGDASSRVVFAQGPPLFCKSHMGPLSVPENPLRQLVWHPATPLARASSNALSRCTQPHALSPSPQPGGIADPKVFSAAPEIYAYGMVCALGVGTFWLAIASWAGYNVSSTHTISECDARL